MSEKKMVKTNAKALRAKKGKPDPKPKTFAEKLADAVPEAKPGKQLSIKGTESKKHEDLDDAVEAYVEVRDERMRLTKDESTKKEKLHSLLKKHGLESYRCAKLKKLAVIEHEIETVKVKSLDEE